MPGKHVDPEQQPVGQEVESQTQPPFKQRKPVGHGAAIPHAQTPFGVQRLAVIPHMTHVPPPDPQLASECARQLDPEQQPPGHEVASQTQLPPTQRWPTPHAEPAPHIHAPAALQLSAVVELHGAHAVPAPPQRAKEGTTHAAPSQQPLGQVLMPQLHVPP